MAITNSNLSSDPTAVVGHLINIGSDTIAWTILFIVVPIIIWFLTSSEGWKRFALHKKWTARFVLFLLIILIAYPLSQTQSWTVLFTPGWISPGSPSLTASAIKPGEYRIYVTYELSSHLPYEKQELVKCVNAISDAEANKYFNSCTRYQSSAETNAVPEACSDEKTYIKNLPVMTRENIINKIKESQMSYAVIVSDACKNVDVSKIKP